MIATMIEPQVFRFKDDGRTPNNLALAFLYYPAAVDLSGAEPAFAAIHNWPVPPIVTRAQWGANEALRKAGLSFDQTVTKLVVHHTGTPNTITDRGIQSGVAK